VVSDEGRKGLNPIERKNNGPEIYMRPKVRNKCCFLEEDEACTMGHFKKISSKRSAAIAMKQKD